MMNFPGVLAKDDAVLDKLVAFAGWHVDGHAPLVRGYDLNAYLAAAIRTDHESTSFAEGQEKLKKGMHLLMREGSIAKDVAALAPLLTERTWPFVAFCTDDRNPLEIAEEGHLDHAIRKAIARGAAARGVPRGQLRAARAFGLSDRGQIAPGRRADIVLLDDLESCAVAQVICGGVLVDDAAFAERAAVAPVGHGSVKRQPVAPELFAVPRRRAVGPGDRRDRELALDRAPHPGAAVPDGLRLPDPRRACTSCACSSATVAPGRSGAASSRASARWPARSPARSATTATI